MHISPISLTSPHRTHLTNVPRQLGSAVTLVPAYEELSVLREKHLRVGTVLLVDHEPGKRGERRGGRGRGGELGSGGGSTEARVGARRDGNLLRVDWLAIRTKTNGLWRSSSSSNRSCAGRPGTQLSLLLPQSAPARLQNQESTSTWRSQPWKLRCRRYVHPQAQQANSPPSPPPHPASPSP